MTCRKCSHEFCWKCMADWATHPKDFYNCALYNPQNDPFLNSGDGINPQVIQVHNDFYQMYGKKSNDLKDRFSIYRIDISKKIQSQDFRIIDKFLFALQWAFNTLCYCSPKSFFLEWEIIKTFPVDQQNSKIPKKGFIPRNNNTQEQQLSNHRAYVQFLETDAHKADEVLGKILKGTRDSISIEKLNSLANDILASKTMIFKNYSPKFSFK